MLPRQDVEHAAAALAARADITLRVNRCRADPLAVSERLESAGVPTSVGRHTDDALQVSSVTPARLPGFAEGWFTVQDEASILVVLAHGGRVQVKETSGGGATFEVALPLASRHS